MASAEITSNLKLITSGTIPTTSNLANGELAFGLVGGVAKLYGNVNGAITDFISSGGLANPLTGSLFVVHSLIQKHSYSATFFGVNTSSYAGYPLKYLKDKVTGDPLYDKSLMREYMKQMTNTEYLPVFGEEIYFYENNGEDIHKLYKVQLQELTPGNGELLCFFELGTPAEVFGLPDKETTLSEEQVYLYDYDWQDMGGTYEATKNISGIDNDSMIWYSAETNSLEDFADAGIVMVRQGSGEVVFGCKEVPQNQIGVIVRWQ